MWVALIAIIILFFDQLTKFLVNKNLTLHQSIPIIHKVLHITVVHNRGAAFGIFRNQTLLFILTSILAISLILFNLKRDAGRKSILYNFSLALILGGALGNLVDRLFLGYVVDFLDFRIWPVFNLADSAITAGALGLGYILVKSEHKDKN
ncbi:MAG: signal peptidase II [Candidatus Omnitrophica bacterium]|nr:signal peptidase II [Candidatus Omnitrophota bacterium]